MSNEKPVELTEAQQQQTDRDNLADLIHEAVNAGGDDLTFDLAYSIAGCIVGSEWLKEHEAAARREAEDDPAHARMYRALVERAERAERELRRATFHERNNFARAERLQRVIGRVEALAAELRGEAAASSCGAEVPDGNCEECEGVAYANRITAALAEPERDEEGGR